MILPAALLCNYGLGFCLIDVGTEGLRYDAQNMRELHGVMSANGAWDSVLKKKALFFDTLYVLDLNEALNEPFPAHSGP